jgi:hypothetical protein
MTGPCRGRRERDLGWVVDEQMIRCWQSDYVPHYPGALQLGAAGPRARLAGLSRRAELAGGGDGHPVDHLRVRPGDEGLEPVSALNAARASSPGWAPPSPAPARCWTWWPRGRPPSPTRRPPDDHAAPDREARALLDEHRAAGHTVGMVGTSGAVHAGHLSLVDRDDGGRRGRLTRRLPHEASGQRGARHRGYRDSSTPGSQDYRAKNLRTLHPGIVWDNIGQRVDGPQSIGSHDGVIGTRSQS